MCPPRDLGPITTYIQRQSEKCSLHTDVTPSSIIARSTQALSGVRARAAIVAGTFALSRFYGMTHHSLITLISLSQKAEGRGSRQGPVSLHGEDMMKN